MSILLLHIACNIYNMLKCNLKTPKNYCSKVTNQQADSSTLHERGKFSIILLINLTLKKLS